MAMLMTPLRSEMTPDMAPKMRGTLSPTAPMNRPGRGMYAPADTQVRNARRNSAANTMSTHS